jgi:peptide/nickel transport system permease protein
MSEPPADLPGRFRPLLGAARLCALFALLFVVVVAIAGPWLALPPAGEQDLDRRLTPPAWQAGGSASHVLGTDNLGRDVASRIVQGCRLTLAVGLLSVLGGGLLGISLGLVAGYVEGSVGAGLMFLADAQLAFPFVLLSIAIVSVLGPGLPNVLLVLVLTGWVIFARVVRGETIALREREFVMAAQSLGARHGRIVVRHLLPHLLPSIIVLAGLQVGRMILFESALSFLGLGAQESLASWGTLLNDGRNYIRRAWWLSTLPGAAITGTLLAINVVGDWLRERVSP